MKKIFIGHDFFGAGNFGDDLMLDGFLRSLAHFEARADVVACTSHDIASQRKRFPSIQWLPSSRDRERERALRNCDLWLGLGGTPFQLSSGPWSLDYLNRERALCRRLGKPMVFLGAGCEGSEAVQDARGCQVIQAAEYIWTRDVRSAEAIAPTAGQGLVDTGADLAHIALGAARRPPQEPAVLGLLLAFEKPGTVDIQAIDRQVSLRAPSATRWLIQEGRSFPFTERWNYSLLSEASKRSLDCMPMNYATDTIEDFLGNFGAPDTVVSSRYHGALISGWHGCRVGVIVRSEKLAGIAADLNVPFVERVSEPRDLELLTRDAARVEVARLQALRNRAREMCRSFLSRFGLI